MSNWRTLSRSLGAVKAATGGRIGKFGGGRTNLLEELGRVEGERSDPNRRAEISRVHSELNRGYAKGGRAGFEHGKQVEFPKDKQIKKSDLQSSTREKIKRQTIDKEKMGAFLKGREPKWERKRKPGDKPKWERMPWKPGLKPKLQPLKKGGKADKNWIQKVNKSIKKRGTKGKCTPITKPGCTGRAKALAKTFKKMAAKRKA